MKIFKAKPQFDRVGVLCRDDEPGAMLDRVRAAAPGREVVALSLREDSLVEPRPDVIVALGGDGTVLRALMLYPHVPVLAINFGSVGFLTAGGSEELESLLARLFAGDYTIEDRIMLTAEMHGKTTEVVNEIAIKGTTKMITVDLEVDGDLVHSIRGDGVLVGTPTGSTSYLMSTGAPIVAPPVQCIVVNGINEYRFASRCLILDHASVVRLRISEDTRETEMFVTHDGRDKEPIGVGDVVTVRRAPRDSRLIFFDSHAFYRNLKSRLDW